VGCIIVTDEPLDVGDPLISIVISVKSMRDCRRGLRLMCVVTEARAVDVSSSHQFEEEIGDASLEYGLFIAKMKFSVQTAATGR
jgi:hypothetical protein